jgi:HlyD family secretion protein
MRKTLIALGVVCAVGGSVYTYYALRKSGAEPTVQTAQVTRGDVADTVGATGTLQAVTSVQVGTQVSGTVMELRADFNSLVRKGQVIARLDPSLFQTQIEQAKANLIRAQAELERLKVALDDAQTKLARARELAGRELIPQSELDAAEVMVRSTEASIRSSQASVTQAEASLNQNQVNLQHTVITAPIDGLVVSRNVDVGQTVAASMNAPTLFVLAADLTRMQVVANLDESDVGRIRPGQRVVFRVDAYPSEDFTGGVAQVRLQPIVQQNVVTYATVINVSNPELKLKPGMTANVTIEIARRSNVVRVPNAALRFRPTNEIFAALGQTPPEQGPPRGEIAGASTPPNGPAGKDTGDALTQSAGSATAGPSRSLDPGERGRRIAERLEALSPEQRTRVVERMRARGLDPRALGLPPEESPGRGSGTARGRGSERAQGRGTETTASRPAPLSESATTIDALFGPLPPVESTGRVWLYENKRLLPVRVRLGITDGQATELLEGNLDVGAQVVTSVTTGQEARPATTGRAVFPPFMGSRPGQGRGR